MTETPDPPSQGEHRLAEFIRLNTEPIVAEWISFAQTRTPASETMTKLALQDHILEILAFIADDLEAPQTEKEQVAKSRGLGPAHVAFTQTAAEIHAELRLADGFHIDQMVSEYRALRASVVKLWVARNPVIAATDLEDLTRFNEAVDQAMTESVAQYSKLVTHSRNIFLGILGHDLRNPIGAASMAAQRMVKMGPPEARQTMIASQIVSATARGLVILNDLLDVTSTAFGMEIPLARKPMDMGQLGVNLVDEMRTIAEDRTIEIEVKGNTSGAWDEARLGQVFSNLIGNAIQYSPPGSKIMVTVADQGDRVLVSVHNDGDPIPPEKIRNLFDPMKRGQGSGLETDQSAHLGLGLFIAKKIVVAHGGELSISSTEELGTTFTALLPR